MDMQKRAPRQRLSAPRPMPKHPMAHREPYGDRLVLAPKTSWMHGNRGSGADMSPAAMTASRPFLVKRKAPMSSSHSLPETKGAIPLTPSSIRDVESIPRDKRQEIQGSRDLRVHRDSRFSDADSSFGGGKMYDIGPERRQNLQTHQRSRHNKGKRAKITQPPLHLDLSAVGAWANHDRDHDPFQICQRAMARRQHIGTTPPPPAVPSPPMTPQLSRLSSPELSPLPLDQEFFPFIGDESDVKRVDEYLYMHGKARVDSKVEAAIAHIARAKLAHHRH